MKKTDKKIDNELIKSLNEVCNIALEEVDGFEWLTHRVNYKEFPASLAITCVFETDIDLEVAVRNKQDQKLRTLIKNKLNHSKVLISSINKQITFDTEEACARENQGKWGERLS